MRKCEMGKLAILVERELAKRVLLDIDSLQNALFEQIYSRFWVFYCILLQRNPNSYMSSLLKYFENEWIQSHKGWFALYSALDLTTNNGLELTNAVIKKQTLCESDLAFQSFSNQHSNKLKVGSFLLARQ